MTNTEYKQLLRLAAKAASQLSIRLTNEQLHDVATQVWEAQVRFENRYGSGPDLLQHLESTKFTRARGAVLDEVRTATWATRGKGPMKRVPLAAIAHNVVSDDSVVIAQSQLIEKSKHGTLLIKYLKGQTMKELAAELGITEAAVSLKLKEFKLYE